MNRLFKHLRTFIFRGLLAVIPLGLCYFVMRFLYLAVDRRVARPIERIVKSEIPGLGIFLVLIILYLLGLAASNWAGKSVFSAIGRIIERIPLLKNIYHLGRQFGTALSLPEKHVFKRAVVVEHFKPGVLSIAFVTGEILDKSSGQTLLKLFIPTAPNPTAGFIAFVPPAQVRDLPWTIEQAMNVIISGGIVGPPEIG
jgi:uncharacterized membrane protein